MSSPNSLGYSSSMSNGRSTASDARKRQTPTAPLYTPNETLNQMTQEVRKPKVAHGVEIIDFNLIINLI